MRRIDPFAGPRVWAEASRGLRRFICQGAKLPVELADLPFDRLTATQIGELATAAARLAWLASELEAMAPVIPEPQRRAPGQKPAAPLPTIQPDLVGA